MLFPGRTTETGRDRDVVPRENYTDRKRQRCCSQGELQRQEETEMLFPGRTTQTGRDRDAVPCLFIQQKDIRREGTAIRHLEEEKARRRKGEKNQGAAEESLMLVGEAKIETDLKGICESQREDRKLLGRKSCS